MGEREGKLFYVDLGFPEKGTFQLVQLPDRPFHNSIALKSVDRPFQSLSIEAFGSPGIVKGSVGCLVTPCTSSPMPECLEHPDRPIHSFKASRSRDQ